MNRARLARIARAVKEARIARAAHRVLELARERRLRIFWTPFWLIIFTGFCVVVAISLINGCASKPVPVLVQPTVFLAPHAPDVLGNAQQLKGTETPGSCRDAGGTPNFSPGGAQEFLNCYACTPGQAGTTCERKTQ